MAHAITYAGRLPFERYFRDARASVVMGMKPCNGMYQRDDGPSNHQYFDLFKMRTELGYRDRVPLLEATECTVTWYPQNRPVETAAFKSSATRLAERPKVRRA
jgi:hypothetical protein